MLGNGNFGQLGNGTLASSVTPTPVVGVSRAVAVSAGREHTCVLLSTRAIQCWGSGEWGQLRAGTNQSSATPVTVLTPQPAAPVLGKTIAAQVVSGHVRVRAPGAERFTAMTTDELLPVGATIDTSHGEVGLTAAGRAQTGRFRGATFRVTQPTLAGTTLTVLTLAAPLRAGCAAATAAAQPPRRLWGDAHGDFRVSGRYATVTVHRAKWLTQDSCAGTLVRVTRGVARVQDRVRHRTIRVTAKHRALVRPA